MALEMSFEQFEELVADALDAVPDELVALIDNCIVIIEEDSPEGEPQLLGLYDGIPLTERTSDYVMTLPDRIFIYMAPTLGMCSSREEVVREVNITVVHEIAHHFGIDDHRLDELGYG